MSLSPLHIHLAVCMHEFAGGKRFIRFEEKTSVYLRKKMQMSALEIARMLEHFKCTKSIAIKWNIDGECVCVFRPGFYDVLKLSGRKGFHPRRRKENVRSQSVPA